MMYKSQNVCSSHAIRIHNLHRGTGQEDGKGGEFRSNTEEAFPMTK